MKQLDLPEGCADGGTYEHEKDHARISRQRQKVFALMLDGQWRTLSAISKTITAPEASVSARLRDLRKEKFGGYKVDRRRVGAGLYEYKLDVTSHL